MKYIAKHSFFLLLFIHIVRIDCFTRLAIARDSGRLKKITRSIRRREDKKSVHANTANEDTLWLLKQRITAVTVESFDGLKLIGHFFPAANPQRIILMMHGWRGSWTKDFAGTARLLHEQGSSLLLVEQRAHGNSEGKYVGFGSLEQYDCHTWVDYIVNRFKDSLPIYLNGVSMGAATVLMAVREPFPKQVKGIIADSGFTTPFDIVTHFGRTFLHVKSLMAVHLVNHLCKRRAGYDLKGCSTIEAMERCQLPVFFAHGTADGVVPYVMTLHNFKACQAKKTLFLVKDADHCMSVYQDKEKYVNAIRNFFQWEANYC
jgi:alpha-beta hydrolase superfamily lysophospholipase